MTEEHNGDSSLDAKAGRASSATTNEPRGTTRTGARKARKKTTAKKAAAKKTPKKAAKKATRKTAKKATASGRPRRKTGTAKAKAASTTTSTAMTIPVADAAAEKMCPSDFQADGIQLEQMGFTGALDELEVDQPGVEAAESCETAVAVADVPTVEDDAANIVAETEALLSRLLAEIPDDSQPAAMDQETETEMSVERLDDQPLDDEPIEDPVEVATSEPETMIDETVTATPVDVTDDQPVAVQTPFAHNAPDFGPMTFAAFVFPFLFGVGIGMLIGLAF